MNLPTVATVGTQPAVIVLDDHTVIPCATMPAPELRVMPNGHALLLPAALPGGLVYHVAPQLVGAVAQAAGVQPQPFSAAPYLLAFRLTDTEARFTVQHGQPTDLIAPRPLRLDLNVSHRHLGGVVGVQVFTPAGQLLYTFQVNTQSVNGARLADQLERLALGH